MREKWIVETKKGDFNGLSAKLKVSPLAVRCLMNRGVESEQEMREFLYGTLDDLHDPFLMKGMDEGFNILGRYLIYLRMKNLRGEGMDFPAASLDDFLSRDKEDTE